MTAFTQPHTAHWPDPDQLGVAETLAREVRRLLPQGDAQLDDQHLRILNEVGIFALFDQGDENGPTQLIYLETLRLLAGFAPNLAQRVAACHDLRLLQSASEAESALGDRQGLLSSAPSLDLLGEGTPAILRLKHALDLGAQLLGCLDAAHDLAESFAAERVLFRKRLADNPFIAGRHQALRAEAARLWSALLDLAGQARCGDVGDQAQRLAAHLGRHALDQLAEALQLCGGTGLMDEFGMPALYRRVMHLLESYRPPLCADEQDSQLTHKSLNAMQSYATFLARQHSAAATSWSHWHELATLEVQP